MIWWCQIFSFWGQTERDHRHTFYQIIWSPWVQLYILVIVFCPWPIVSTRSNLSYVFWSYTFWKWESLKSSLRCTICKTSDFSNLIHNHFRTTKKTWTWILKTKKKRLIASPDKEIPKIQFSHSEKVRVSSMRNWN